MKYKFLTLSIPVLVLIIASFYITSQFIQPAPKKELTIATGSKSGNYYKTALEYQKLLQAEGIKVTIINTAGSVENLQLLKDKKVDISFIQNGIASKEDGVELLSNIYYEPLWIFYKDENHTIQYLLELVGKTISIGQENSGTQHLSQIILKENTLDSSNATIVNYSSNEAKEKLINGEIDALFMVSSANSSIVKELLENQRINVFSTKRAKAYSRRYTYLEALNLYEGTMHLQGNIPYKDIQLLGTTANLIARPDLPDELSRILIKKVKEVHNNKSLFAADNHFPNTLNTNLDINKEAQKYLQNGDSFLEKIFPYWIASNIDRLKILLIPILTLLFPLFKGVLPLYQWTMRSKIYKWYDQVNDIDQQIPSMNQEELQKTAKKLESLKDEIQMQTKVPLSFMGEYYNLIMHVEMILAKTEKSIKAL